jgi:putative redox protein
MTTLVRAVGATGSVTPAYQVDVRVGRHRFVADEPHAEGGADVGPSPFGLLLSALVACTATTLRMDAARHGWELSAIDVDVRYNVDAGHGAIERTIAVPMDLPPERRQRLAEVAERTPVTLAIRNGVPITTTMA